MRKHCNFVVSAFILAVAIAPPLYAADPRTAAQNGQHAETFEMQVRIKLDYLLYLPVDYKQDADKKWPLILFLHGSGERGSDVKRVKAHGPPMIVDAKADSPAKQFIIVSPQCPEGHWWRTDELIALLDEVVAKNHVDADRIYLTGLSMGGFGTWSLATDFPDRFAAIAPVCGGAVVERAASLKKLPIWVFHGAADGVVPVKHSDEMVEALKKLKADVKYTRYPGVDHDCWTQTYANPELYAWFLSHKRSEKLNVQTEHQK